ncbi:hypothetical protein [Zunongwangia sp.]|uniref:hypothetical protein n=1 Tax=Zunongwangia sp. TaxID=1965325 RepID=UPI003AA7AF44
MAPIKLEEHIKEQLAERRISPSAGSWDKLNARLDETENRQKLTKKWWLGIAALLVVAFSVGGYLLNFNSEINIEPQVVDSPSEKPTKIIKNTIKNPVNKQEIHIVSEIKQHKVQKENSLAEQASKVSKEVVESQKQSIIQVASLIQKDSSEKTNKELPKIDKINPEFINPTETQKEYIVKNESKIQQKLKEALQTLETNNIQDATDAEVNELLLAAAADLEEDYKKDYANPYTAEALLAEAEGELDRSFRDKIFDLLKEGYSKAKNAVALD